MQRVMTYSLLAFLLFSVEIRGVAVPNVIHTFYHFGVLTRLAKDGTAPVHIYLYRVQGTFRVA